VAIHFGGPSAEVASFESTAGDFDHEASYAVYACEGAAGCRYLAAAVAVDDCVVGEHRL
jgi:hypothetical protein